MQNTILMNQLQAFEGFVESLDEFIKSVKRQDNETFDLRTSYGDIFNFPITLTDYMEIWESIMDFRLQNNQPNDTFLDVYANYTKENYAQFIDKTMWVKWDGPKFEYIIK